MPKLARFVLNDVYSTVVDADSATWRVLREACRARPKGYQWMPSFRRGTWDGYFSLIAGNKIPTGLMRLAFDELRSEGYTCEHRVVCGRIANAQFSDTEIARSLDGVTLRDYQVQAVQKLLNKQRGIADMATNAGKTVVFAALIKALGNADAVVVVNTKDLLYQTSERLSEYIGRRVGLIGDGKRSDSDVVVATIQSLNATCKSLGDKRFRKRFVSNRVLVIDECHHVADNRTFDVLMHIPGWHRYGVSGTPLERGSLSDLKLIACTGPVQVTVTNMQLIENGWSAEPFIQVHDLSYMHTMYSSAKWHKVYDTAIVRNDARNSYIVDLALEESMYGPVLVVVTRIDHGKALCKMIAEDAADKVIFVNGSSPMDVRQAALSRMARGDKCITIATQIFDEGVDVPALDSVILACAGKSRIKLLQRIGRGLRKKDGDNELYVHDFNDGRNKYLKRHYEERTAEYARQGFEVEEVHQQTE